MSAGAFFVLALAGMTLGTLIALVSLWRKVGRLEARVDGALEFSAAAEVERPAREDWRDRVL